MTTGEIIAAVVGGLFGIIFIPIVIASSFYLVRQQTAAVIERFGRYVRTAQPGLHTKIPLDIEKIVDRPSMRIRELVLDMESKTKDDVTVTLRIAIQYVIPNYDKVFDAYYKLIDYKEQIESWVYDAVRSMVPNMTMNQVYENKDEIAKDVEEKLAERMQLYGFEIVRALVNDVIPPSKVKDAMNEVNTQQRLQVAAEAEGEKNKILIVKNAEAEAKNKELQGIGIANQRKAIIEGYKEAVQDFTKGIPDSASKDVMSLVIISQYFETLDRLGGDSRSKVIFLPSNPGAAGEWMQQMTQAFASAQEAGFQAEEPQPARRAESQRPAVETVEHRVESVRSQPSKKSQRYS